jgi:hypothetical protein
MEFIDAAARAEIENDRDVHLAMVVRGSRCLDS